MEKSEKFGIHDWVKKDREKRRGMIISMDNKKPIMVRWVKTDRAEAVAIAKLKKCKPPPALYLEGSLRSDLASPYSAAGLLRTWLDDRKIDLRYKNIHCLKDIEIIGEAAKNTPPLFVHIACHGDIDDEKRPFITLDPLRKKRIYFNAEETVETFKNVFAGSHVLLSACWLGTARKSLECFAKEANLGSITAYTPEVAESECMLFELMLYQGVYFNGKTLKTAVKNACDALKKLECRGVQGQGQRFALTFYP